MTTRNQILRSSTPGAAPAVGARLPGELWTTFPDLQLGVIDATKTAQKLIAVRFFSTQANYVAGDFVIQGGKLYFAKGAAPAGAFNASQWSQVAALTDIPAAYVLPIAATSVLGGVKPDGVTTKVDAGGVLTSAGLVAVSAVAPSPVQNGALWYDLVGGQLYAWVNDGTSSQWVVAVNQSLGGVYLPMSGGTLTGPLTLAADPVNPLDAATKHYVDAGVMGDNRVINGDMRIDARNNGASGAGVGYTVDRWAYSAAQSGKGAWQRVTGGAGIQVLGFGYVLQFISSSAYTPLASDNFCFYQMIEADMMADFAWGTAGAQPVTLSFIVNSSLTGTFGGVIRNQPGPPTRSYPFTFSIPVANTWTKIAITIPGDTAGAWVLQGNAAGLQLMFDLGSGATLRGPANAWAAANYFGATGAVSVVGTNAATFNVTGVKLEIGSVATPYNRQSLAKSMADCQRYFVQPNLSYQVQGWMNGTSPSHFVWSAPATMRAVPTIVASVTGGSNYTGWTTAMGGDNRTVILSVTAGSTGQFSGNYYIASLSAEL